MKRFSSLLAGLVLSLPSAVFAAFPAGADSFASAPAILAGEDISYTTDLLGFTLESGEPSHHPNNPQNYPSMHGGASAWWKWTAPENGFCTVDTALTPSLNWQQSVINTTLSVYVGSAVNGLTRVVANDNMSVYNWSADYAMSKATFYARAGFTYYIAVDGAYSGSITNASRYVTLRLLQLPAAVVSRRDIWSLQDNDVTKQGLLSLTTTATGSYSAVLQIGPTRYTITGLFEPDGTSTRSIARTPLPGGIPRTPIVLRLNAGGRGSFMVEIDGEQRTNPLPRQLVFPRTSPCAVAGTYNLGSGSTTPEGARGYQRVVISTTGTVTLAGVAPDGTVITSSSNLHQTESSSEFQFPGYVSLHGGKGAYSYQGTTYTGPTAQQHTTELSVTYLRPAVTSSALVFYPMGLVDYEDLIGRQHVTPAANNRILGFLNPLGNGLLRLFETPGETASLISEGLNLSTANRFTFTSLTRKPALTVNTSTGIVTGSITTTDTILGVSKARPRVIRGLIFNDGESIRMMGHASGVTQNVGFDVVPGQAAQE